MCVRDVANAIGFNNHFQIRVADYKKYLKLSLLAVIQNRLVRWIPLFSYMTFSKWLNILLRLGIISKISNVMLKKFAFSFSMSLQLKNVLFISFCHLVPFNLSVCLFKIALWLFQTFFLFLKHFFKVL